MANANYIDLEMPYAQDENSYNITCLPLYYALTDKLSV